MILFKNVRYKNFLSSGNVFTKIDLDRSKTTLIIGENDAGKSARDLFNEAATTETRAKNMLRFYDSH